MRNYSRQRETILNIVKNTHCHPNATWVYQKVREQIPNISIGTVYRNLALLSEAGEICTLSFGDGQEHYDGYTCPHLHLICTKCGKITDVDCDFDPYLSMTDKLGFEIESCNFSIKGICNQCKNK